MAGAGPTQQLEPPWVRKPTNQLDTACVHMNVELDFLMECMYECHTGLSNGGIFKLIWPDDSEHILQVTITSNTSAHTII